MNKLLLCVVGPTASGKTDLAITLAQQYTTEILSADSRQVFTELNIGTAKPTAEQLSTVKHHFINSHSINTLYTAGDYERDALAILHTLFKTNNVVVLCGGTGLYIKALCEGLDALPYGNEERRQALNNTPIAQLQEILQSIDAPYYYGIDINNKQRVVRAIEVYEVSGKPMSSFLLAQKQHRNFDIIKVGIDLPRQELYNRINSRVDDMMDNGLLNEAQQFYNQRELNALKTVGYKELYGFINGDYTTLDEAVTKIKQHTRNYAKRQLTWFKADNVTWIKNASEVMELLKNRGVK
ncbi:MAG: tRNA (adenosine(37)-N6)-dimethylallyltransferase MiaA [Bacteroidia bacterium]